MPFDEKQKAALNADLDSQHVSTRSQANQTLSYIEAWRAIAEANRIFGPDGWTRETLDVREVRPAEIIDNKWRVGFMARVRVHAGGVFRDGCGYGSGIAKDMGDAYESAIKEAESDATKRSLSTFGWPLGLALYDKSREHVGNGATRPQKPPREEAPKPSAYERGRMAIENAEDAYTLGLKLQDIRAFYKKGGLTDEEMNALDMLAEERRAELPASEETEEMRNLRAG